MRPHYPTFLLCVLLLAACNSNENSEPDAPEQIEVLLLGANTSSSDEEQTTVEGVAADGVSQIEFAIPYYEDLEVEAVTITPMNESWGTLDSELSAPTLKNGLNAYRFTLTASEELPTALLSDSVAQLRYEVTVTTEDGVTESFEQSVDVVRPPALFVHGLASDASTYDVMLGHIRAKGLHLSSALYAVDYKATSVASYQTNQDVVPNAITELLDAMSERGIVCEKVSVVGHSMGGILTRIYMQGRSSVAYRSDIYKLFTIDTPHSGSQLADFALAFDATDITDPDGIVALFAGMGAVEDLAVASEATATLNATANLAIENALQIPTHVVTAHIGTITDIAQLVGNDLYLATVVSIVLNAIGQELLYNGEYSDIVVPISSQEGGVESGLRENYVSVYANEWHCSILACEELADALTTMFDAERSSNYFTNEGFNPPLLSFTYNFE